MGSFRFQLISADGREDFISRNIQIAVEKVVIKLSHRQFCLIHISPEYRSALRHAYRIGKPMGLAFQADKVRTGMIHIHGFIKPDPVTVKYLVGADHIAFREPARNPPRFQLRQCHRRVLCRRLGALHGMFHLILIDAGRQDIEA